MPGGGGRDPVAGVVAGVAGVGKTRLVGCVYVDLPAKAGHDAEVWLWVRASELASGLEDLLYATVRRWVEECWPFERVVYPGRELPLDEYEAPPDR